MNRLFCVRLLLIGGIICSWQTREAFSQITSGAGAATATDIVLESIEPDAYWEFGIEITATSNCRDILATCPIPANWPEQEVEIFDQEKSDRIAEFRLVELPQNVRLMQITIDQLPLGETARSVLRVRIKKKNILPPTKPDGLSLKTNLKGEMKNYIQPSPYIESTHKKVKDLAASIELDTNQSAWLQVETIYDAIRERFPYEFDPVIRTCPEAIDNKKGDCEELTSLFIAVCRVKKIPARAIWIPSHTYAEFCLVDPEGKEIWLPCQLAGPRQFGQMNESKPILQKGDNFKLPLDPKPTRYIAPQLRATQGTCAIKLISQEVDNAKATGKK